MALDLQRILEAAAQAAVADQSSERSSGQRNGKPSARRGKRLTGARAFLIGAGVVTAGRLATAARRGELMDGLQQRLIEYERRHFGDSPEGELDDADLPEDELDEEDEPTDDQPEDEDEPGEEDEPTDDQPEDEADEDQEPADDLPEDELDEDPEPARG